MPLPVSSLSIICKSIAEFVGAGIGAAANGVTVLIGSPANAVPVSADSDQHNLNLFFYRFEPAGFGPGPAVDEVWQMRMFCLVTAFCTETVTGDEDASRIGAGENDLRLLGEVVRLFHETPVLPAVEVLGETVRLQVVFQPLGAEEINHLWSTLGDVGYRPSVAYEMALTPVVPKERDRGGPLVGALGSEVRSAMDARYDAFRGVAGPPPVEASTVEVRRSDWNPRICFVLAGVCAQSLSFDVAATSDLPTLKLSLWVAGDSTVDVDLRWEVWRANTGWQTVSASVATTKPLSHGIDPEQVPTTGLVELGLPFRDQAGQAVLYAIHKHRLPSDAHDREAKSNPLLLTMYGTTV